MDLHSPTTLLSNIQFMKNRLRSDKELLKDIKNDFNHFSKKPRPPPIETIMEESIRDSTPNPNLSLSQQDKSNDKAHRAKMIEMKKQYQKEMTKLKQEHQVEMQKLLENHQKELAEVEKIWKNKVEQQAHYISILEEQVSSPIHSQRDKASYEQYDAVINQLLQQNTRLHNQLQIARDQCEHFRKKARNITMDAVPKSKFQIFSRDLKNNYKTADTEKTSHFISQMMAQSRFAENDENRDTSNFSQDWGDEEIENDEGGMRTIKEFPLGMGQYEHSKASLNFVENNQ